MCQLERMQSRMYFVLRIYNKRDASMERLASPERYRKVKGSRSSGFTHKRSVCDSGEIKQP